MQRSPVIRVRRVLRARGPLLLAWAVVCAAVVSGPARADEKSDGERAQTGPLRFDRPEHDYGIAEQNQEYVAEVGYRNVGDQRLTNIRVKTDCGCYAASITHRELAPGEAGTLRVRFRTLSFSGLVRKTLRLAYDAGGAQPLEAALRLKLSVLGGVIVLPGRLHFGDVLAGTRPSGAVSVVWYEGVGVPFQIRGVESGDPAIEARVEPFADAQRPQWKGWRVSFRFRRPPPRGVFSKRARVRTTHKDVPQVVVPLTAHVVGKVWVQRRRIHLGLVPRGEAKSAWITFRPFQPGIELGTVTARARGGVLQTAIEPWFGPAGPGQRLRVTVPADAPPGPVDDVVELRTQVPGEEVTEIQVRGRVYRTGSR